MSLDEGPGGPEPKQYLELLKAIAIRPAMYVGITDFFRVCTFLDGYTFAIEQTRRKYGMPCPDYYFVSWLLKRFKICHPAWGWKRIIYHQYHDHKKACAALPTLFQEYLDDVEKVGLDNFESWLDEGTNKEIREKLGMRIPIPNYGAPDCNECKPLCG
jgi:hypothetical protein